MTEFPLFPLPEMVVFPGMTLPLFIFEERYKRMVKSCVEQNQRRIVIVLAKPQARVNDGSVEDAVFEVGSFVDILSAAENPDGTFNILTHGQERCRVKVSSSEKIKNDSGDAVKLLFTENLPYPLERDDPNLERLAAWDALDVFRTYATTFFSADVLEQVENALPDDLLFQASFICANLRAPSEARQQMLEASSLIGRFTTAQRIMQGLLEAHPQGGGSEPTSDYN